MPEALILRAEGLAEPLNASLLPEDLLCDGRRPDFPEPPIAFVIAPKKTQNQTAMKINDINSNISLSSHKELREACADALSAGPAADPKSAAR